MDKIHFAENLTNYLPGSYNKNLSTLTEVEILAMHEDRRRWNVCEERFKPFKTAGDDRAMINKSGTMIKNWLAGLAPKNYQDDMRRRINTLRDKFRDANRVA